MVRITFATEVAIVDGNNTTILAHHFIIKCKYKYAVYVLNASTNG